MDTCVIAAGASKASQLAGQQVVVVGAGVIGLSTAIELRLAGANVTVFTSPNYPMVSPMACALFLPWMGPDSAVLWSGPLERAVVNSWHRYESLLNEFGTTAGIRSATNHEYLGAGDPDPPDRLRSILTPSTISPCNVQFVGNYYDRVWKFETIVIDMSCYMSWLGMKALSLGIAIKKQHLESLSDTFDHETYVIVNCSGLGARTLAPDKAVRPVRGQVLFFKPIDQDVLINFVGIGIGEYCLIPRITDVGLGSLFEQEIDCDEIWPGRSERNERRLWAALDALVELSGVDRSALEFSGRTSVGLRPIREGGYRLEALWHGDRLVVHNYGHGGLGVTVAWGCANQVVDLIRRELAGTAAGNRGHRRPESLDRG
ncbi:MAG: FAD-dependent oxidoreductase [Propionibacteriaceae bacterium]|jgi:D-amino-acid oxidase